MAEQQGGTERYLLDDPLEAIEFCYRMGWSDGLPIVPPTEERVHQFLEHGGCVPSDVVLVEPVAGRVVTAEKAAANAVMAGCLPEYFPVVLAALDGMGTPEFNLHGASLNTGGAAVMAVINGPIVQKLDLNSGVGLFCPGYRANATIGRALHLVLGNCTGNRPNQLDKTVMGHPGRYSMCIAEREEALPPGWEPFHVEKGLPKRSNAVTVFMAMHPTQTAYHSSNPQHILTNVAETLKGLQPWHQELLVVMAPEVLGHLGSAGWSKADVREFLYRKAQRSYGDYQRALKMGYPYDKSRAIFEAEDMMCVLERPEALDIVAGGGDGGPFMMIIPLYGLGIDSKSVTREIKEV